MDEFVLLCAKLASWSNVIQKGVSFTKISGWPYNFSGHATCLPDQVY